MSVQELNDLLTQGILPDELNFSIKREYTIDLNKIKYNAFYRSYEFYENKFPKGYNSIPGFDKIIDSIAVKAIEKNKSPLDELEELEREIKEIEKVNNNID
jgi:DNA replicative helicase MCM subunit Mcm2 (Cdc46/Mcm family)